MPKRTVIPALTVALLFAAVFSACRNKTEIPFPAEGTGYAAPVTEAIQFGPPERIDWPEKAIKVTSTPVEFPYDKLPVAKFDSLGFQPFAVAPERSPLNLDKLPAAAFNFDQVPEVPLRFRTSVIPAPKLIRVGRPTLKSTKEDIVFDFPEPVNGTPVAGLLKTRDGLIWIATRAGFYKYDGENLYEYKIDNFDFRLSTMAEDKDGKIWLVTRSQGLFVLDLQNGVSHQMSSREGLPSDCGIRILVDHQNRIWVSFYPDDFIIEANLGGGFLLAIDQAKKSMKFIRQKEGLCSDEPAGIAEDNLHNIWVSSAHNGMSILDLGNKQVRYLNKEHGLSTDTLTSINIDTTGRIWTTCYFGGANIIDVNNNLITKLGEQQGFRASFTAGLMFDRLGNGWIASERGIRVIDPALRLAKNIDRTRGLAALGWGAMLQDDRDQIWLGNGAGLNLLQKNSFDIRHSSSVQVSSMLDDGRGRVWIGTTESGIQLLDTATGLVKLYDKAHGLSDNFIQYMVQYNGTILLSTQGGGIEIIDSSMKKIERIGVAQGVANNLMAIESDDNKNVWLGGEGKGLDVLDMHNRELRHIGTGKEVGNGDIVELLKDYKGRIWFYSFSTGLGIIDVADKTVRHVVKTSFKSLTGQRENDLILHDSRNNTWLLSSVNGLFMINPAGDSVTHLDASNGLLSNRGLSIIESHGRFYVGTNLGINIITPPWMNGKRQWLIESLGKSAGLSKTVNTYNSDLMLKDGQYWWGDDGVTILSKLEQYLRDTLVPPTYITGFDVLNHRQHFVADPWTGLGAKDTIWSGRGDAASFYTDHGVTSLLASANNKGFRWDSLTTPYQLPVNLHIPYDNNYLRFHFAQSHLGSQDIVWYKYIFEGIDQKWSEKTDQPFSENYSNIPPGHYTFKVASYYRGKWSAPVSFSFTILSPWWSTWWAWLMYLVIIAVLLRAYIAYRSRKLLRENRVLEEKVTLRTTQLQTSIEELKATQSQLIQSEKMASLGELTAGIAHEIQNPLNFINNFSEINKELLGDMKDEIAAGNTAAVNTLADDIIANEEKINHHGRRADGIVKSMLQHSRSSQHAIKESTDINKLSDEYLRLAYHGLRAKDKSFNATLKTEFDQSIGPIKIMANDMGRVILNLITNAFYAVGEKKKQQPTGFDPTVSVFTRKRGGKIEIEVRDNANGIPQKVLDKIFQPFFTTKPAGQGTGLGLSLAYDIVKAHGGELKVETKDNEGTSFIIILPI